jgi:hypothetical protein
MSRKLFPLALQEISSFAGFTHMAIIDADDLTMATAATAQKIKLGPIPAGAYVHKVELRLVKPFKDASDAAFNTTAVTVGDNTAANTFITTKELNENGTEIVVPALQNTSTGPYTAADEIDITFNSMTGKKLVDIDVGEVHLLVQIFDPKRLSDVKALSAITTK